MKHKVSAMGLQLLPAIVTVAILLGCARAPALREIPALLSEESMGETEEIVEECSAVQGTYSDGVYVGTGTGYGGEIKVQVTVKSQNITAIEILSAANETASFFKRAMAVVDAIIAQQTWKVDAISGATYSSNGIKAAVQNALTGETVVTEKAPVTTGNTAALTTIAYTAPEGGYTDGIYTGSAQGFGGLITVEVLIVDGKIASVTVVSAAGETPSYLSRAMSVTGSIVSAQSPNVDTISGATYSSKGIINAVKAALENAANNGEKPEDEEKPEEPKEIPNFGYPDGVYTGTGEGFGGPISLSVTVKDGQITAVEILSAEEETESFFQRALGVIDRVLEQQTWEVDVVSGATYSSEGILSAIAQALSEKPEPDPEPDPEPGPPTEPDPEPDPNPSEEVTTEKQELYYTGTATVSPDEYKDFEAYDISVQVTVTTTTITSIKEMTKTVTTKREVTGITISSDTDSVNQRYLNRAFNGMQSGLIAGLEVDAVSGATCSSVAIRTAVANALAGVTLGTTEETVSMEPSAEPTSRS